MMITRQHQKGDAKSWATYSACERYRFALNRVWNAEGRRLLFIMLNPSTATEVMNDPSVERCERRARALGYGALRVCNLFGWRSTDPRELKTVADPVGIGNDEAITKGCRWAEMIICAWGTHGVHASRDIEVGKILRKNARADAIHHLGLSKAGLPRHPLYIAYAKQPEPWPVPACRASV